MPSTRVTLAFPGTDALVAALRSGLIPTEVAARPVAQHASSDQELVLSVGSLPRDTHAALLRTGVREAEEPGPVVADVPCWALLVPTDATRGEPAAAERLFFVPQPETLLTLAAEIVRLGCVDLELGIGSRGAYLRTPRVPYYLELRTRERRDEIRIARPAAARGVWVEVGRAHRLEERLVGPEHGVLLVTSDGIVADPVVRFVEASSHAELVLPHTSNPERLEADARTIARKLRITPRLARARRPAAASLWKLEGDGFDALERWIARSGEAAMKGFEVALLESAEGVRALVRGRLGRASASPNASCRGYASTAEASNLWIPADARIEPPLATPRLARALGADAADDLVVLDEANGALVATHVAMSAFRPLEEWAEVHVERSGDALVPWVANVHFELSDLQVTSGLIAAPDDVAKPTDERPRRARVRRSPVRAGDEPTAPAPLAVTTRVATLDLAPGDARRCDLERALLADARSLAEPELASTAFRLATLLDAEGEPTDATQLRAWALSGTPREQRAAWARASLPEAPDAAECARRAASSGQIGARVLALLGSEGAHVPEEARAELASAVLDPSSNLPVPLVVDAARRLSELAGGDDLLLTHAQDVLRRRLASGLAPGVDVPSWVRRADLDRHDGLLRDPTRASSVLDALLAMLRRSRRKAANFEAPWAGTLAMAGGLFAIGQAHLGAHTRAEAAMTPLFELSPPPPEHLVVAMVEARVRAAGRRHVRRGLPPELSEKVGRLPRGARHAFDRVLATLSLLGGGDVRDPFAAFVGIVDPRDVLAAQLDANLDPAVLADTFDRAVLASSDDGDGLRAAAWALQLLPPALARPRLRRLVEHASELDPLPKVRVLGALVASATAHEDADALEQLLQRLEEALEELEADEALTTLVEGRVVLDALVRAGRSEEAVRLANAASVRAEDEAPLAAALEVGAFLRTQGQAAEALDARIGVALRQYDRQQDTTRKLHVVPSLVRALLACRDEAVALAGLEQLVGSAPKLAQISYATRSFSLTVAALIDGVVAAFVADVVGWGPRASRILHASERHLRARVREELEGDR